MKLVFDIGATHTRLALTDGKTLQDIQRFDTDVTGKGIDALLGHMDRYLDGHTITAAIGGMPGQLDRATGRLVHSTNTPGWTGKRVGREIAQHLGVPLTVRNDVEMVGLGEALYGAGQGNRIVVYLTVSTGVNGARIVDGVLEDSSEGFELGAQLVEGQDHKPHSLEGLTGGAALSRTYHKAPRDITDARVWRQEAQYLALGLYNTILHWSPDVVVMGGSMMRDIDVSEVATFLRRLPRVYDSWPPIVRARLVDDGGLYGAMALSNRA